MAFSALECVPLGVAVLKVKSTSKAEGTEMVVARRLHRWQQEGRKLLLAFASGWVS